MLASSSSIAPTLFVHTTDSPGAILSDTPSDPADPNTFDFKGSSLILEAASKAEVIEFLKTDVYYKEGVWDVENVGLNKQHLVHLVYINTNESRPRSIT